MLARSLTGADRGGSASDPDRRARWGFALAVASMLLGAAWASGTAVAAELGPFDSPYQPAAQTAAEHAGWNRDVAGWPALAAQAATVPPGRSVETAETSAQVSQDILATGREYLPVGGFTGQVPATSVRQLEADVQAGVVEVALVWVTPRTRNPAMEWAAAHCHGDGLAHEDGATYRRVVCLPSDVSP
jgi:hypothetical protein